MHLHNRNSLALKVYKTKESWKDIHLVHYCNNEKKGYIKELSAPMIQPLDQGNVM